MALVKVRRLPKGSLIDISLLPYFFNLEAYGFLRDFILERSYSVFMCVHLNKTRFSVRLLCVLR